MTDKNYNEFLETTGTGRYFVEEINDLLLDSNCKREIKTAKSGFTVLKCYTKVVTGVANEI